MKNADFIGTPCHCPACRQAGIAGECPRRDPDTGAWLHGEGLRRWLAARAKYRSMAAFTPAAEVTHDRRGRRTAPLRLVDREPGMDD